MCDSKHFNWVYKISWRSFLLFRRENDESSSVDQPKCNWGHEDTNLKQTHYVLAQNSAIARKKMMQEMKKQLPKANENFLDAFQIHCSKKLCWCYSNENNLLHPLN